MARLIAAVSDRACACPFSVWRRRTGAGSSGAVTGTELRDSGRRLNDRAAELVARTSRVDIVILRRPEDVPLRPAADFTGKDCVDER
jgi:hypothetical protein